MLVATDANVAAGLKNTAGVKGRTMSMNGNLNGQSAQAKNKALHLYEHARSRNLLDTARFLFNNRSRRLLDLEQFYAACMVLADENLGVQSVSISQIQGSVNAGRSYDFDTEFRPLRAHNKERWLGLAAACAQGMKMPPVVLVKIGDIYFVQDGHHRISVAKAIGQTEVEAVVTEWQVAGPLPWAKKSVRQAKSPATKLMRTQSSTAK